MEIPCRLYCNVIGTVYIIASSSNLSFRKSSNVYNSLFEQWNAFSSLWNVLKLSDSWWIEVVCCKI